MPKTRHLRDLYVMGKEETLEDGRGDSVTVWIQKVTPSESAKVLRKANAARSRMLGIRERKDSEEYLDYFERVRSQGDRDDFIEALTIYAVEPKRGAREDELAAEEKWAEDDLLQGLLDDWNDGLKDTYALDPEDPDAKRTFELIKEFNDEVEAKLEVEREQMRKDFESDSDEELMDKMVGRLLATDGDYAWMEQYSTWLLYFAVRDPETKKRYFESQDEVTLLQAQTINKLRSSYEEMAVGNVEGKD